MAGTSASSLRLQPRLRGIVTEQIIAVADLRGNARFSARESSAPHFDFPHTLYNAIYETIYLCSLFDIRAACCIGNLSGWKWKRKWRLDRTAFNTSELQGHSFHRAGHTNMEPARRRNVQSISRNQPGYRRGSRKYQQEILTPALLLMTASNAGGRAITIG